MGWADQSVVNKELYLKGVRVEVQGQKDPLRGESPELPVIRAAYNPNKNLPNSNPQSTITLKQAVMMIRGLKCGRFVCGV